MGPDRSFLVREALGDHRRDAIAHRDAVEGVRDLHRALLMRDHDQLRGLLQLLENREQARQIHVVQAGLNLDSDPQTGPVWNSRDHPDDLQAGEVQERERHHRDARSLDPARGGHDLRTHARHSNEARGLRAVGAPRAEKRWHRKE